MAATTAVEAATPEASAVESSTVKASVRRGNTRGAARRITVGDTSMIESAEGTRMKRAQ